MATSTIDKGTYSLFIKKVPPDVTEEEILIHFLSRKNGGNGEVTVKYSQNDGSCVLVFQDKEVFDNMLRKPHVMNGHRIEVCKLEMSIFQNESETLEGMIRSEDSEKICKNPQSALLHTPSPSNCDFTTDSQSSDEEGAVGYSSTGFSSFYCDTGTNSFDDASGPSSIKSSFGNSKRRRHVRQSEHDVSYDHIKALNGDTGIRVANIGEEKASIWVHKTDICTLEVDVIVNAANDLLQNHGGVAAAISTAAGPRLQRKCDELMSNMEPISISQNVVTKGYRLPCKYVVHAVGPSYSYVDHGRLEVLYRQLYLTVRRALESATEKGATSIALPAISCGIFSMPRKDSCEKICRSVVEYLRRSKTTLRHVHLVGVGDEVCYMQRSLALLLGFSALSFLTHKDIGKWIVSQHDQESSEESGDGLKAAVLASLGNDEECEFCPDFAQARASCGHVLCATCLKSSPCPMCMFLEASADNPPSSLLLSFPDEEENESNTTELLETEGSKGEANGSSSTGKLQSSDSDDSDYEAKCGICLDYLQQPLTLPKCKHEFCKNCIDKWFKSKQACPICKTAYGVLLGNQPPGKMTVTNMRYATVPGFKSMGAIKISYNFSGGVQTEEHPNPGKRYFGTQRDAYLPDNPDGRQVLHLLRKAFDRRLTFTIGRSVTTGMNDQIVWNGIHHKTSLTSGVFGYPDPQYLDRVKAELQDAGVCE